MTVNPRIEAEVGVPKVEVPEPFDLFFRREFRLLVGLARALSGSQLAAEDIAQEALVAAYRRWEEVGAMDNPGAWVRRVVANKAVSVVRRRVSEVKGMARLSRRHDERVVSEMSADSEWIWGLVRRLPKRQAQVVALYYFDGLSMPEIGEVLKISKDTVNTHLRRAKNTLADQLEQGGLL